MNFVSTRSRVSRSAYLGKGVRVYGPTTVGPKCIVEDYVVLGKPDEGQLVAAMEQPHGLDADRFDAASKLRTVISAECILGEGTQVYTGAHLGRGVQTEDHVLIGISSKVGAHSRLMYRAQLYCRVVIGEHCRIAGYVGSDTVIEDEVAFFGSATHDYPVPSEGYEARPAPRICRRAVVAFGAQLIGGVRVGPGAYVGANAIVTRDVPANVLVLGANLQIPIDRWTGRLGEQRRP